jgi:hypothetical protein
MANVTSQDSVVKAERSPSVSQRANALADRLEQGARALAAFASALTDAEWQTRVPNERKVSVIVHPRDRCLARQLAQTLAAGKPWRA